MSPTIQQLDSGKNNNFNLIRFGAATLVIFSHSWLLTGNFKNEPLIKLCNLVDFGSLGVKVFFAVSGYLITKSFFRQKSPYSFVWARILRIFPGLSISSIFCVFIIGPLATNVPLSKYFVNKGIYNFLWRQTTLHACPNTLPGVFLTNPISNNVNAPIWTLPGELFMYLCVFIFGLAILIFRKQVKLLSTVPLLLAIIFFFWGIPYSADYMDYILYWGILFFLGMLFYFFNSRIKINIPILLLMLIFFLFLFHMRFRFIDLIFDILLVYAIFVFSYHPKLQIKSFHQFGDLSYGLYIYTFPIQQLLVLKLHGITSINLFVVSYFIALPVAALSWYYIEKPILKFKTMNSTLFPDSK